jgi:hypothetical protein
VRVTWVSTPRYYRQGSLIVPYVGCSAKIVQALQATLGSPIAIGRTPCNIPDDFDVAKHSDHWPIVPFGAIVNANPGSSPLPGVVVFWTNRMSFRRTFRVTAPVRFSSQAL